MVHEVEKECIEYDFDKKFETFIKKENTSIGKLKRIYINSQKKYIQELKKHWGIQNGR